MSLDYGKVMQGSILILTTAWGWIVFVYEALLSLITSDEICDLFTMAIPWLSWLVIGASLLIAAEAALKLVLRSSELSLVSLLYFFSLPVFLARPLLKHTAKPDTDPADEEPNVPAKITLQETTRAAKELLEPSAAERVELALIELGVPLSASDHEIKRAYLKHVREHHPRFLRHAPRATQEMSAQTLARIRQAYEVATGKVQQ